MKTRSTDYIARRNTSHSDSWNRPVRSPHRDEETPQPYSGETVDAAYEQDLYVPDLSASENEPYGEVHDFRDAQRRRATERREARRAANSPDSFGSVRPGSETPFDPEEIREEARRLGRREAELTRYDKKRKDVEDRRLRNEAKRAQCPACHWGLFVLTTLLAFFSIPVVYSASTPVALGEGHAASFYMMRQAFFVIAGYLVFLGVSRLGHNKTRVLVWGLYAVALLGLLAIDFTPLGYTQSGVRRWLKLPLLPPQQFSELAKIALIGIMADFWSRASAPAQKSRWPWYATGALTLPVVALVAKQPHLSAALLLLLLPVVIAVYSGAPIRRMLQVGVPIAVCALLLVVVCKSGYAPRFVNAFKTHNMPLIKDYQQDRIAAFLGANGSDTQGSNYQKNQSVLTIILGGLLGRGPAESLGKQGHLPEPHTDFIFAVIGEEYGLLGTLSLLTAYAAMVFFCFHIGHCAESDFEALLCAGVGTLLAIQVTCNVGVATGVMPVTGMPLPFMSYGGSGLVCTLIGIGMVLSVSRQTSRSAQREAREAQELASVEAGAAATQHEWGQPAPSRFTHRSQQRSGLIA